MVNEETGRELDMAVAETLFGYVYTTTPPDVNGAHGGTPILVPFAGFLYKFPSALPPRGRVDTAYLVPHYTTQDAEAQALIRHLNAQGLTVIVRYLASGDVGVEIPSPRASSVVVTHDRTWRLALCRAAIRAWEVAIIPERKAS